MSAICIKPGLDAWLATSDDPEWKYLFGTDTIPTPFRMCMPADKVLAEVRKLNPHDDVSIIRSGVDR